MVRRMDRKTGEICESNSLKDPSRDRVVQGDADAELSFQRYRCR